MLFQTGGGCTLLEDSGGRKKEKMKWQGKTDKQISF